MKDTKPKKASPEAVNRVRAILEYFGQFGIYPGDAFPTMVDAVEALIAATKEHTVRWQTGTPDVPEGRQEVFWCCVKNEYSGKTSYCSLVYQNKHAAPLSDSCADVPDCAEPIENDDEFLWTGWFHDYTDEEFYTFDGEVLAFMRLPRNYRRAPKSKETTQSPKK